MTGLVLLAAFFKAPAFPTNDPALFEYYGRHMLRGQRLYVDLWDNKLPSIYLVNEFWQWLFGTQYRWHVGVEMLMNAGSVGLFAALLRRYNLASWPWATFVFAAVLVLPPAEYDYTEFYALPLILGALLAVDIPLVAGACIALAATFWIPSLLVGIVICWQERRSRRWALFVAGVLGLAIPYALAFVLLVKTDGIIALLASWPAYLKQGTMSFGTSRMAFIRSLYEPAILSGAGAAIATFLACVRRPENAAQGLAIGWICATVIGAAIPGHPSFHHFIPALAALVFGITAFTTVALPRRNLLPRAVAALLAVFLLASTARSVLAVATKVSRLARSAQQSGACIDRTLGTNAVMFVPEFAPELYLAADAALGNPYAMVDPVLDMTERIGAKIRSPDVFIGLTDDPVPTAYRLQYDAAPWRVFMEPRVNATC